MIVKKYEEEFDFSSSEDDIGKNYQRMMLKNYWIIKLIHITKLIKEIKLLQYDLNGDIYPICGVVYIIDLGDGYYKLGWTDDLNKRMQIYETGFVHKKKVLFYIEAENADSIESCAKGLLKIRIIILLIIIQRY